MKNILKYIFILVLLINYGCKPDEFGPIGEPFNKTEQLAGTWKLTKAEQIDVDAEEKNFPIYVQRMDITNKVEGMPFTDFAITFNKSEAKMPTTFTAAKGNAPIDVPTSGNWSLDDPEFASAIILDNNGQKQELEIASFAEINSGVLVLKQTRLTASGKPFLRYEYYLKKQ